jgi:hypothetical protein
MPRLQKYVVEGQRFQTGHAFDDFRHGHSLNAETGAAPVATPTR